MPTPSTKFYCACHRWDGKIQEFPAGRKIPTEEIPKIRFFAPTGAVHFFESADDHADIVDLDRRQLIAEAFVGRSQNRCNAFVFRPAPPATAFKMLASLKRHHLFAVSVTLNLITLAVIYSRPACSVAPSPLATTFTTPLSPRLATTSTVFSVRMGKYGFNSDAWMHELYQAVDAMRVLVQQRVSSIRASGNKLPLPEPQAPPVRTNTHLHPIRYNHSHFARDTSYYWRYVYAGAPGQDLPAPEGQCTKKGRYFGATFAIGAVRQKIAKDHTIPSCLHHGIDEMHMFTEADFDADFLARNKETLAVEKGKVHHHWQFSATLNLREFSSPIFQYM
jgi:hypothetical protein